jgi:hypothetical protein
VYRIWFYKISILDTWWLTIFAILQRIPSMWEREKNMYIMLVWVSYRLQHVHIDWPFFWTRYFCILFLYQGTTVFWCSATTQRKSVQSFLSTWILSWQKKNIIVFAVYVDKFKFFLFTPQNISSACIPRKFPSRAVSGADNMKLAVQSSERKTFFSSYRIVSEFPVREYSI